ncbi:MAG: hypothetical protein LAN71_01995 [Acidobacteriia bacterium]|nr:hypothetical protein [Terriglobia bacterium]
MAEYAAHIGSRVEVHYRAGEMSLSATGILAADSGRSIFLEERIEQDGRKKQFRWEIPYSSILRIVVNMPGATPPPVSAPQPAALDDEDLELETEPKAEKKPDSAVDPATKPNLLSPGRRPQES